MGEIHRAPRPQHHDDDGRATLIAVIEEAVAVGDDIVDRDMAFLDGLPAEVKASMLVDLEAGSLVHMGRDAGVPTPVNRALYAVIRPHAGGRS